MKNTAKWVFIGLTIVILAGYLPFIYDKVFHTRIEKTHLLFSPVIKKFVWKEKIVGPIPPEARAVSEDHHAEIAYRDENARYYSREEFEKLLPFIYYKNMALWGLLPLRLEGRLFDSAEIKNNRRVLELKTSELRGRRPEIPVYPLLESNPKTARLVFPEDRFRPVEDGLEFINADTNRVDPDLSRIFTEALEKAGFHFPAQLTAGKHSILKPFDDGVFLVDARGAVFHLKRRDNLPLVVRTPIETDIAPRHIKVSENRRREYHGLLLGGDNSLYLIDYDDYGLIRLPLDGYEPDRMDFKLLINPLYATAVYSDEKNIHGVVMDRKFQRIRTYSHVMSRSAETWAHMVDEGLFPFKLRLDGSKKGYLNLELSMGGWWSLVGIIASMGLYYILRRNKSGLPRRPEAFGLIAVTGIYGLIAGWIILDE